MKFSFTKNQRILCKFLKYNKKTKKIWFIIAKKSKVIEFRKISKKKLRKFLILSHFYNSIPYPIFLPNFLKFKFYTYIRNIFFICDRILMIT